MRNAMLVLLVLFLVAVGVIAETNIIGYPGFREAPDLGVGRYEQGPPPEGMLPAGVRAGLSAEISLQHYYWVVPLEIDLNDPVGSTTLLSVMRGIPFDATVSASPVDIDVELWDRDNTFMSSVTYSVSPRETVSVNTRIGGFTYTPEADNVVRGIIFIRPTDGGMLPDDLNVDYFQVDNTGNFANGDIAMNQDDLECWGWKVRYFNGGPFAGGAKVWTTVNGPRGSDLMSDPYTLRILIYDEPGTVLGTVFVYTSFYTLDLDVSDLLAAIGSFEAFGGMVIELNSFWGTTLWSGTARNLMTAAGKYSVGMNGVCLNPGLHP